MFLTVFGFSFLLFGCLILLLPFMLIELTRPRDWLLGSIFLFLGFFLIEESDFLRGSINLLVIAMTIIFISMIFEIVQNRWNQLTVEEKKLIGSFERWVKSFIEVGQIFLQLSKGFLNLFKIFNAQDKKSVKEKKWVRPELKEEIAKQTNDSNEKDGKLKRTISETTKKEETS